MLNLFTGGALSRMGIFALGIMPYISASIIVQLLGTMYGPWQQLKKEGEQGRKKLNLCVAALLERTEKIKSTKFKGSNL